MVSAGCGMPTRSSISIAAARACRLVTCWCSMMASMIWLPTVCMAENDVIGSWNTIAISAPRISRMALPWGSRVTRSTRPWLGESNRMLPSTIAPFLGTMRRIDWVVTLLPQPLSPAMPRVSPGASSKLRPSTALTVPCREKKWVCSPRTLSRAPSAQGVGSVIRPWRRGRRRRAGRHPGS